MLMCVAPFHFFQLPVLSLCSLPITFCVWKKRFKTSKSANTITRKVRLRVIVIESLSGIKICIHFHFAIQTCACMCVRACACACACVSVSVCQTR